MSKYSDQLGQFKSRKEIFLDNFIEDFEAWFETNQNNCTLSKEEVEEIRKNTIEKSIKLQ